MRLAVWVLVWSVVFGAACVGYADGVDVPDRPGRARVVTLPVLMELELEGVGTADNLLPRWHGTTAVNARTYGVLGLTGVPTTALYTVEQRNGLEVGSLQLASICVFAATWPYARRPGAAAFNDAAANFAFLKLPRFRGHPRRRENAPGVIHGKAPQVVHERVQG